ncbi:MAG: hypothetical protein H8E03_01155 [Pelagibacteraceae bacterium]|nr:hypothetical protein [Pelagibacteraceae bacterium]
MIIEILLGFSSIALIISVYVIWNLLMKTELLESWVETFTKKITTIRDNITEIDSTGHFEADDEIGTTFKLIKDAIDELQQLEGEEVDAT